jgi:hypothetical protein
MADKYTGLCETCEHDATCLLRRSPQLEIIQCEEFSTQPMPNKALPAYNKVMPQDPVESAQLGVCANCLNVITCGFPSARQGVLQCEEYILDEAGVVPAVQPEYSRSAA